MTSEERKKHIGEHLKKVEFASLDELSELLDVSASTVRRDLTLLESEGLLKRTHGGARWLTPSSDEFVFSSRQTHELESKTKIAVACANLIEPNQTIILDAGSTVCEVAKRLEVKAPHIITNSLPVANLFTSHHQIEVILSGGVIYPRLGVLVGPRAVEAFASVQADVAIMGAGGLSPSGVTNSHVLLIDIQHAMMKAANRVILCVDHTKWGRQSLVKLCDISNVDTIVTTESAPSDMVKLCRDAGCDVITVSS